MVRELGDATDLEEFARRPRPMVALFLTLVLMVMDHVLPVLGAFVVGTVLIAGLMVPARTSPNVLPLAIVVAAAIVGYLFAMAVRVVDHPANHAFV